MKATLAAAATVLLAATMMTMSQPLPQLSASPVIEEAKPVVPLESQTAEQPIAQDLPASDTVVAITESNPEQKSAAEPQLKSVEPEIKVVEEQASVVPASEPVAEPKLVTVEATEVVGVVPEADASPVKVDEPAAAARSEEPVAPKTDESVAAPLPIEGEKHATELKDGKGLGEAIADVVHEAIHTADLISAAAGGSSGSVAAPSGEKETVKTAKSDVGLVESEGAVDVKEKEIVLEHKESTKTLVDTLAEELPEAGQKAEEPVAESEKKSAVITEMITDAEVPAEAEKKVEEAKEEEKEVAKEEVALEEPKESSKSEQLPEAHKLTETQKKPEESKAKPDLDDSRESSEESSEEKSQDKEKKNGVKDEDESSQEASEEESDKKSS